MSNSAFLPTNNIETETEKPNPGDQICFSYYSLMDTSTYDDDDQDQDLQLLDCIADHLHNHPDDPISPTLATTNPSSQSYHPLVESSTHPSLAASYSFNTNKPQANTTDHIKCERGSKMDHVGRRIAFRTKSVTEIMDDGFKWRKYGRKMVKSSPNPRNYYKCSNEGCKVKKRVERDGDDSSYVITTYEGIHNHESPSFVCFNEMPRLEFNS